jgi:SAM-dependent methyltransferase
MADGCLLIADCPRLRYPLPTPCHETPMTERQMPEICDYEGSTYRTDFWEGRGRDYEDQVERIAIRRLLPPGGERLLDVGAGFGRYTDLFSDYRQVVLLDYSRSQLEFAREHYGDEGYLYVAADVYRMPFAPGAFDAAVMVRVLHHMQQPEAALAQIRGALRQGGSFVLEFANKRNLKSIARWLLRRQAWNPFDRQPVEFAKLNFDFHPDYVRQALREASFAPGRTLTVSHYRIGLLKRLLPTGLLVAADSLAQFSGGLWQVTPSVFVRSRAMGADAPAPAGAFWRCPECGSFDLGESAAGLICGGCRAEWGKINGVYDFKQPLRKGKARSAPKRSTRR